MQNTGQLPTSPPLLPFFAWAIPPEYQWRDIATRDPHPPIARDLLQALAALQGGYA